jgi:hypothetical protein
MSGTTTHYGWPYPTGTDAPPDVAGDMQALASAQDTTLFTFASGYATVLSAIGTYNCISQAVGAGTQASATFANFPGTNTFNITKKLGSSLTNLAVRLSLVCFSDVIDTQMRLAVLINGVDNEVAQFRFTPASTYFFIQGEGKVTGLAAATYSVQARWAKSSGSGTLTTASGRSWMSMAAQEVPV